MEANAFPREKKEKDSNFELEKSPSTLWNLD